MGSFQKLVDWWFGVERATVPQSTDATKHIMIYEHGQILTAAELYEDVIVKGEKEMIAEREAFLSRVGDRMN